MKNSFGATTTADEVLRGIDLRGKRVLITGVSAGLGVESHPRGHPAVDERALHCPDLWRAAGWAGRATRSASWWRRDSAGACAASRRTAQPGRRRRAPGGPRPAGHDYTRSCTACASAMSALTVVSILPEGIWLFRNGVEVCGSMTVG